MNQSSEPSLKKEKYIASLAIVVPFLATLLAIYLWSYVETIDIVLFVVMYFFSVFGISIGYHRYFSHRTFKCKPWFETLLGIAGSMAMQGQLLYWVSIHRKHHHHTDQSEDPHSPLAPEGSSFFQKLKYFWRSHAEWILQAPTFSFERYAPDLINNKSISKVNEAFPIWVLLGLVIPGVIAGLWTLSWMGAFMGVLWGGLVRIFVVQHITFSINSICHLFGKRSYETKDHSKNNWLVALLSGGEGWHNNHHAYPTSARHSHSKWQIDLSYYCIWLCKKMGIIWDVKLPSYHEK